MVAGSPSFMILQALPAKEQIRLPAWFYQATPCTGRPSPGAPRTSAQSSPSTPMAPALPICTVFPPQLTARSVIPSAAKLRRPIQGVAREDEPVGRSSVDVRVRREPGEMMQHGQRLRRGSNVEVHAQTNEQAEGQEPETQPPATRNGRSARFPGW